jgi:hypothetical protein
MKRKEKAIDIENIAIQYAIGILGYDYIQHTHKCDISLTDLLVNMTMIRYLIDGIVFGTIDSFHTYCQVTLFGS